MKSSEGQSRRMSMVEVSINMAVGYVIAVFSQWMIFPLFGLKVSLAESATMGIFFTVVSIVRSYVLRRVFNRFRTA